MKYRNHCVRYNCCHHQIAPTTASAVLRTAVYTYETDGCVQADRRSSCGAITVYGLMGLSHCSTVRQQRHLQSRCWRWVVLREPVCLSALLAGCFLHVDTLKNLHILSIDTKTRSLSAMNQIKFYGYINFHGRK